MIFVIVIIGLAILVLVHEFGHFLTAKILGVKVEEFGVGFPPRVFGKKIGGTIYSVNALPFGGFVRLHGEDKPHGGFNDEPAWKKSIVVVAGVLMNLILGWVFLSIVFMTGVPKHLVVSDVAAGSPAMNAGLKTGDVVINVSSGNLGLTDPISADDFSRLVKSGQGAVNMKIERGSEKLNAALSPRANPPEGQGPLGVIITEMGFEPQPFFGSFVSGFSATWDTVKLVFLGLISFFTQLFTAPGAIENVAGPVGIVFIAVQATSLGFAYLIQLLALISINLAILNLLPFPALDGGRFLFVLLEKIVGRPISRQAQIWINGAGFAILIFLMIFVTVKDVYRFL